jgi:hypothetical protein
MKGILLEFFVAAFVLAPQLATPNFISLWPRDSPLVFDGFQNHSFVPFGQSAGAGGATPNLLERQLICVNTGYGKFVRLFSGTTRETNYYV